MADISGDTIPANFEFVMAVVVASFFVHNVFMALSVGSARRKYRVRYPKMYASKENCPRLTDEDANTFNCIQRAHQNSLEILPIFLALLICAGLKHPIAAGITGLVFLALRVVYFMGYSTGAPENRATGAVGGALCLLVLVSIICKSIVVWGVSLTS